MDICVKHAKVKKNNVKNYLLINESKIIFMIMEHKSMNKRNAQEHQNFIIRCKNREYR